MRILWKHFSKFFQIKSIYKYTKVIFDLELKKSCFYFVTSLRSIGYHSFFMLHQKWAHTRDLSYCLYLASNLCTLSVLLLLLPLWSSLM